MKTDHIKIHVGRTVHDPETYVEVNGQRLILVQDVKVELSVKDQKIPKVKITILTQNLDIAGDIARLEVGDAN